MKISAYLLIDANGAVEVRKRPPAAHLRQVAIKLSIRLDDSWFTRSIPVVELTVPNDYAQPIPSIQIEPLEQPAEN